MILTFYDRGFMVQLWIHTGNKRERGRLAGSVAMSSSEQRRSLAERGEYVRVLGERSVIDLLKYLPF